MCDWIWACIVYEESWLITDINYYHFNDFFTKNVIRQLLGHWLLSVEEMFEENIGVNRSRNSEERLYNGKKKNDKMIYKILHGKLRLRNMNPPNKNWGEHVFRKG